MFSLAEEDKQEILCDINDIIEPMGFDGTTPQKMIEFIDKHNVPTDQLSFPEENYKEFKQHVLDGLYDEDEKIPEIEEPLAGIIPDKLEDLNKPYKLRPTNFIQTKEEYQTHVEMVEKAGQYHNAQILKKQSKSTHK